MQVLTPSVNGSQFCDAYCSGPELKAKMVIWSENITIDSRYCQDDPCRDGSTSGNYTYLVPVSQYFHTDYIVLDFV